MTERPEKKIVDGVNRRHNFVFEIQEENIIILTRSANVCGQEEAV